MPSEPGTRRTLTLIIHGTFAKDESWWRPSDSNGEPSFADRLETALAERGLTGTVWNRELMAGFGYDDFAWSGENRHRHRVKGARKLRASLERLAQAAGASASDPLQVNVVAHSHGGNVVLEALRRLPDSVRIGRIALLGTPLLASHPAFRVFRFLLASLMVLLLGMAWFIFLLWLIDLLPFVNLFGQGGAFSSEAARTAAGGTEEPPPVWVYRYGPLVALAIVVGYGAIFAGIASAADVLWRALCLPFRDDRWLIVVVAAAVSQVVAYFLYRPFFHPWWFFILVVLAMTAWVFQRFGWRYADGAYGPRPRALRRSLGGRPFVLFTSHHDEAALLLETTSAPVHLYDMEMARRLTVPFRLAQYVLLRPLVVGLFLRVLEIALERFALGFPWYRVLAFDYGVADIDDGSAYPAGSVLKREDVTDLLRVELLGGPPPRSMLVTESDAAAQVVAAPENGGRAERDEMDRHAASLRETIGEVLDYIKSQVKLRHSLYYENQHVIDRVAAAIAES